MNPTVSARVTSTHLEVSPPRTMTVSAELIDAAGGISFSAPCGFCQRGDALTLTVEKSDWQPIYPEVKTMSVDETLALARRITELLRVATVYPEAQKSVLAVALALVNASCVIDGKQVQSR